MDRDTKIGLTVAALFLALVGGVLYYKISHPDELASRLAELDAKPAVATAVTQPLAVTVSPTSPASSASQANNGPPAGLAAPAPTLPPGEPPAVVALAAPPPAPPSPPPVVAASVPAASPEQGATTASTSPPAPVTPEPMPAPPPPPPPPVTTVTFDSSPPASSPPAAAPLPNPPSPSAPPPPEGASAPKPEGTPQAVKPNPAPPSQDLPPAPPEAPVAPVPAPLSPPPAPPPATLASPAVSAPPAPAPAAPSPPAPPESSGNSLPESPAAPAAAKAPEPNLPPPPPAAATPAMVDLPAQPTPPAAVLAKDPAAGPPSMAATPPAQPRLMMPPPPESSAGPSPAADAQAIGQPTAGTAPQSSTPAPSPTAGSGSASPPVSTHMTGTLPPDNAVVRDYRPAAVLGKPQMEPLPPTTVASRGTPPPTNVTPVTIRPQPDLPTHDRAIPVVPRGQDGFGYVTTAPGRSFVQSYDLQSIVIRPNETFATLSAQVYGTERYQHALAEFLRDRDPRLTQLVPGQTVDVPPAEELERRYARLVPPANATEARAPVATASAPGWAAPTGAPTVTSPPASAEPRTAPSGTTTPWPAGRAAVVSPRTGEPTVAAEKRYRVQVNDTLYGIAKRTLGSGDRWTEIYELNKDLLQGGTQLQANMLLRLPADAKLDVSKPSP